MENEIKIFEELSFNERHELINEKLRGAKPVKIFVDDKLVSDSLLEYYGDFLDIYNHILTRPISLLERNELQFEDFRDRLRYLINEVYYSLFSEITRVVSSTDRGKLNSVTIYHNNPDGITHWDILQKRNKLFKALREHFGFVSYELEITIESVSIIIN